MSSSISGFPTRISVTALARMTRAVECGFIAAGITVAVAAAIQSIVAVAGWIAAL